MFKWEKMGRVFDPTKVESEWLNEFAQAPSVLKFDDFIRVYFSGRPKADSNGQYVSYTGFADFDRKDITKLIRVSEQPIMQLGKKGTFDEFGVYPTSVIREGEKVIAYFGGWTRCVSVPFNVAIGRAESTDDGISFRRTGDGPILSYSQNEPFILSGPKVRRFNDRYYLFYIAGSRWIPNDGRPEPVYKIRMAVSEDGINWTKQDQNLIADKLEEDEAQASPDVICMNGRYHMFFCYRYSLGFRSREKGYRIGYAVSDDLINWERKDEMAGIDVSENGWDDEMVSYPHVFELDGEIYMYYLGNGVGRYGFGLAKLNRINSVS